MQQEMLARATEALEMFWHNIQDICIDLCNTAAKNSLQLPPSSEIPDNSFFFFSKCSKICSFRYFVSGNPTVREAVNRFLKSVALFNVHFLNSWQK